MPSLHSGGQYEICNAAASRGDCAHWAPMRCRWDQDAELFEGAGRRGFVLVILVMSAVSHTAFFSGSWVVVVVLSQNAMWQG